MITDTDMSKTSPWADALELWWQALAPSVSKTNQPVFRKFIDQGKSYFRLNEEFMKVFQQLPDSTATQAEWQSLWKEGLAELQKNFANLLKSEKTLGFWELPLDNWRRVVSSLSVLPGDFLHNLKTELMKPEQNILNQEIAQLLSLPDVGYTQAWPDHLQEGARLWADYQKAQEEYVALFGKIGVYTMELLNEKVIKNHNTDQPIDNLRMLYDLWVDCGEEAYAKFANTDEYSDANARLINSLMAWKQYERKKIDEVLAALNMPTRQEVDTINYRMQEMQRALRNCQAEQNNLQLTELQKEMNVLRVETETLKTHPQKPKTTRTTQKTTPTKKTTPKPTTAVATPKTTKKTTAATAESKKPTNKRHNQGE